MKKVYESPELDITLFDYDILTVDHNASIYGDWGSDEITDENIDDIDG